MRKTKPLAVPEKIYEAAEAEAKRRRKKSGDLIRWSDVVHEILRKHFKL